MSLHPFVNALASLQLENCFNPYADRCSIHDQANAPQLRAKILSAIIVKASKRPIDAIWIGRDLGYRGGRRTGLALTDDVHISCHAKRWSVNAERPTKGEVVSERTAAVVWELLDQIDANIFLWNVFPLHPHKHDEPFTNRAHTARERRVGEEILEMLIPLLRPKRIIAIGNDASSSATRSAPSVPIYSVRHPSYGGQTQFMRQIHDLYGLRPRLGSLF